MKPVGFIRALCVIGAAALVGLGTDGQAQTAPTPGPTNPVPPDLQSKPGATIVVNPTADECNRGWAPEMKWTKEQFDQFCARLRASK